MGAIGPCPSPPPPLSVPSSSPLSLPLPIANDTIESTNTEAEDECVYSIMTINKQHMNKAPSSNSNIDSSDQFDTREHPTINSLVSISYGRINGNTRRNSAPTLATGRRSKFTKLEGDADRKREIRRRRNREAARKLKVKRESIEQQLGADISNLESREKELLWTIKSLQLYKEQLEKQCEKIVSIQEKLAQTATSSLRQTEHIQWSHQSVPIHDFNVNVKQENRSSSPQWQLLFSI